VLAETNPLIPGTFELIVGLIPLLVIGAFAVVVFLILVKLLRRL
jgi:hypothetical protein